MPHRLLTANIPLLEQGATLLANIDDDAYVHIDPPIYRSGVGGHLRHCLDHYHSLQIGLRDERVDYDHRARDLDVETLRHSGIEAIHRTIAWLSSIDKKDLSRPLLTRMDCGDGMTSAADWTPSTLGRELQFMVSHTTHHFALMAMVLRQQSIDPGDDFGVASSTRLHAQSREPMPQLANA